MLPSLLTANDCLKLADPYFISDEARVDLNVDALVEVMAGEDEFMRESCSRVLRRCPAGRPEEVRFRQRVAMDAIARERELSKIYIRVVECLGEYTEHRRKSQPGYARFESVSIRIRAAAELMDILLGGVRELRGQLAGVAGRLGSEGLKGWIAAFNEFFCEDFLEEARLSRESLARISEGMQLSLSARFGEGLKGTGYIIRGITPPEDRRWPRRERPDTGVINLDTNRLMGQALGLRNDAYQVVFRMAQKVNDETYKMLHSFAAELGFYLGGARLYRALKSIGVPLCFPDPLPAGAGALDYEDLVDASLALKHSEHPVGNSLLEAEARLIIVTGANQGGKSTFLRSLGLAHLMMQSGLFVAASRFSAGLAGRLLTHFCRPEDPQMLSGKLDEELNRMDGVISHLGPDSILLMNESFSSTTEREGEVIAGEVVSALYEVGVRVAFVTHLSGFAADINQRCLPGAVSLSAGRREDGSRTYRVSPGPPGPTGFGLDLFEAIIGAAR